MSVRKTNSKIGRMIVKFDVALYKNKMTAENNRPWRFLYCSTVNLDISPIFHL